MWDVRCEMWDVRETHVEWKYVYIYVWHNICTMSYVFILLLLLFFNSSIVLFLNFFSFFPLLFLSILISTWTRRASFTVSQSTRHSGSGNHTGNTHSLWCCFKVRHVPHTKHTEKQLQRNIREIVEPQTSKLAKQTNKQTNKQTAVL